MPEATGLGRAEAGPGFGLRLHEGRPWPAGRGLWDPPAGLGFRRVSEGRGFVPTAETEGLCPADDQGWHKGLLF